MAVKLLNIDYKNVTATAPYIDIEAVALVNPLSANVSNRKISTSVDTSTISISAKPVGIPAIPGLYRGLFSKPSVQDLINIMYSVGRVFSETIPSVDRHNTVVFKNNLEVLASTETLTKSLQQYNAENLYFISNISKALMLGLKLSQYSNILDMSVLSSKAIDISVATDTSLYLYNIGKYLSSIAVPTDDTLGEAELDDDQVAWVTKNLYSNTESTSIYEYIANKIIYSSLSTDILYYMHVDAIRLSPLLGIVSKAVKSPLPEYYSGIATVDYTDILYIISKFIEDSNTTGSINYTDISIFKASELFTISTIDIGKSLDHLYEDQVFISTFFNKLIDSVYIDLSNFYEIQYAEITKFADSMPASSDTKIAFIASYFNDPSYAADPQYVGTQIIL